MITIGYLIVAALLFSVGLVGALARKEILRVFIAIEVMVAAANLALVALLVPLGGIANGAPAAGFSFVVFVWFFAVANAAVGLSLFLLIRRRLKIKETDALKQLSG